MSSNGNREHEAIEAFAEEVCNHFVITISPDRKTARAECRPRGLRKNIINDIAAFPECEDCVGRDPGIDDRSKIKEIYEWYMLRKKEAQAKEQEKRKGMLKEATPNLARDPNPAGKTPL